MTFITDEMRRARRISSWERRYREGTLPEADDHAGHCFGSPDQPLVTAVERFVRAQWGKSAPHG